MRPVFEMTGARGLEAFLERASTAEQRNVEAACRSTSIAVQRLARGFAPRERGDLVEAIQFTGKGTSWRVGLVDRAIAARGGRNTAHLNPAVYGVWYELGFRSRDIRRQPFMDPAAQAQQAAHQARLERALAASFRGAS